MPPGARRETLATIAPSLEGKGREGRLNAAQYQQDDQDQDYQADTACGAVTPAGAVAVAAAAEQKNDQDYNEYGTHG